MSQSPSFIVVRNGTMDAALVMASFALRVAHRHLPTYSSHDTSRRFTQPQLMACLVLRAYLGSSLRSLVDLLEGSAALRRVLGLHHVPHFYTFKRFADRLDEPEMVRMVGIEAAKKLIRFTHWIRRSADVTSASVDAASDMHACRRGAIVTPPPGNDGHLPAARLMGGFPAVVLPQPESSS